MVLDGKQLHRLCIAKRKDSGVENRLGSAGDREKEMSYRRTLGQKSVKNVLRPESKQRLLLRQRLLT